MKRKRHSLALLVAGAGMTAALGASPAAVADPQLPSCEDTGGSSVLGGQVTDCASPGNVQIDATPQYIPGDDYGGFWGFPGYF